MITIFDIKKSALKIISNSSGIQNETKTSQPSPGLDSVSAPEQGNPIKYMVCGR